MTTVANGEIRQKIVLDGEKQYKQALKDAQRELKTLQSELKAETAELGKNATEQEKNAVKVKNLKKQIEEQEKIVKTYTEALKEVKEKYADNEDEIAKWEVKLNNARTALANMKSGLDSVDSSVKATSTDLNTGVTATKSFADSLDKIGEVGGNVSSIIEDVFLSMVGIVQDAVGQIWGQLLEIAAKSDNYMDLASFFGSSATDVQKWDNAMKSAGGSMDTVTQLITKLKYSGKDVQVAKWFALDPNQYSNDLNFFQKLMQRMADNREEMKKAGTWDEAMKDIFGNKKGFDVEGILSDWDDIINGLNTFDAKKGGYGLSEDDIQNMSDLNIQIQTLKQSWEQLKEMGTVQLFGSLAMDLTSNAQGIVDAMKKYFGAETPEERQQAIDEMKKNIEEAFRKIADGIREGVKILDEVATELQQSEDPIVRTLGNILGGITGALEWLTEDNMNNAVKALEILAAFWLTGNGLKMATTIAGIVANIAVIRGFNAAGGAASAASATAGGAAAGGGGGFLGAVGGVVAKAAPWLLGFGLVANDSLNNHGNDSITDEYGNIIAEGFARDENGELYDTKTTQEAGQKYTAFQMEKIQELWDAAREHEEWKTFEQNREDRRVLPEEFKEIGNLTSATLLGNEDIRELLQSMREYMAENENWREIEDLPADWWKKGADENGVTSEDIQGLNELPGLVKGAVMSLIGSIRINMDGEKVADLVTERVSENLADTIMHE